MAFEFFPEKNIILQIGSISLYFYGAMYSLAAIGGIFITEFFAQKKKLPISRDMITDSIIFTMIGGVIGGRMAEILIYNFDFYLANPLEMLAVWHGGMSIHGGLIGGGIAFVWYWKRQRKKNKALKNIAIGEISGVFMPALAMGLMLGRFGNFMNDELYGRITEVSWGMDFGDGENRHPSQLYAVAKDFTLFGICSFVLLSQKFAHWKNGEVFLVLIFCYGFLRFIVEFFKEVDAVTGLFFGWMTIGQIFSVAMIILSLIAWRYRKVILSGKK
jgi:phosphatidylglycerol:prolipoprotein diacylglycerol transferase